MCRLPNYPPCCAPGPAPSTELRSHSPGAVLNSSSEALLSRFSPKRNNAARALASQPGFLSNGGKAGAVVGWVMLRPKIPEARCSREWGGPRQVPACGAACGCSRFRSSSRSHCCSPRRPPSVGGALGRYPALPRPAPPPPTSAGRKWGPPRGGRGGASCGAEVSEDRKCRGERTPEELLQALAGRWERARPGPGGGKQLSAPHPGLARLPRWEGSALPMDSGRRRPCPLQCGPGSASGARAARARGLAGGAGVAGGAGAGQSRCHAWGAAAAG